MFLDKNCQDYEKASGESNVRFYPGRAGNASARLHVPVLLWPILLSLLFAQVTNTCTLSVQQLCTI
jgi:hypothetical protein